MKVTMHSGRTGSAKHNDRSFLEGLTSAEQKEIAPHIDQNMMELNEIKQLPGCAASLEESELETYTKLFTTAVEATNRRYTAQGHKERCKTVEDLYKRPQTRPEETIYQIGNCITSVDIDKLHECYRAYAHKIQKWCSKHNSPFIILNYVLHADETTPHIHERRVWLYRDKDGNPRPGQNRALQAAGVPLPHPDQPAGRYNNRKMTFDRMARQMWIETCREHGIKIDDVPVQGVRHKDKQEYMAGQIADLQRKLDKYEQLEARHPEEFARLRRRDRGARRFEER